MSVISSEILKNPLALFRQFEVIEDSRIDRHQRYPLLNILILTFVAIMSDGINKQLRQYSKRNKILKNFCSD